MIEGKELEEKMMRRSENNDDQIVIIKNFKAAISISFYNID